MVAPAINARIEEADEAVGAFRDRAEIGALRAIAKDTGKARFSAAVRPPCFSLMTWSIWQPSHVPASWIKQYSQSPSARAATSRRNSAVT